MTLFGIAALLAPVVGPTLGGYITDNYGWRWIFYLNVPVGLLALVVCRAVVVDPDYLKAERAELRSRPRPFDALGLGLLSVTMVCWEVLLSKGQEWDWLGDPFYRVQTLADPVRTLPRRADRTARCGSPTRSINFRTLRGPQLRGLLHHHLLRLRGAVRQHHDAAGAAADRCSATTPPRRGWCCRRPGCSRSRPCSVVGVLLGRGADARYLIGGRAGDHGRRQLLDVAAEPGHQPVAGGLAAGGGDRRPVDDVRAAERGRVPAHPAGSCAGRPWGCWPCCATRAAASARRVAQTIQERREQFHTSRLNEQLDPFNPAVESFLSRQQAAFVQQTGDVPLARRMAWQALENQRDQQALALAYFDVFWASAAVAAGLVVLVLLMRRSVAEKGAHVGAE